MIELKNICRTFFTKNGAITVLTDVNLTISKGDLCAVTGASGSGKTSLMNIIGLLDQPSSGKILFRHVNASCIDHDHASYFRNNFIGFVFQSFFLLPRLSAIDNVALPLLYRGMDKTERRARAMLELERVGLTNRRHHKPDELSGGQCQRVAIARALVGRPGLLLADEPTGSLDSTTAGQIMDLFTELNRSLDLAIVIITHDPSIAARCPRRIVMRDGHIVHPDLTLPRVIGTA